MIKNLLTNPTKLYANWMGWFTTTGGKHLNIYQSDDPQVIRKQVTMAKQIGLDGFVVDWYGNDDQPSGEATKVLAEECRYQNFEFSIMIDAGEFKWATTDPVTRAKMLQDATDYVMANFATMPNYSQINGRPLVWEFGWRSQGITTAPKMSNALLLAQDSGMPGSADGATFAWVNLGGVDYLKRYLAATTPIQVPCLFVGFDDHDPKNPANSIWGGPARLLDPQNGDVFLGLIKAINATGKTYPAIQFCTWNDYEERTRLEIAAKIITGTSLP